MPRVSIVIPVYNTAKYVARCLECVINQTYDDFEVIVINDGSKDNSLEIIHKYTLLDSRVIVIDKNNEGVSTARNDGLNIAKGEYVWFVDSDDSMDSNMLEVLVDMVEANDCEIACCQYDRGVVCGIDNLEIWNKDKALLEFLIHSKINGSLVNKLFKRSVIGEERLNKNIRYGEDALFLWKVLSKVKQISITNRMLYHVELHDDSSSGGCFKKSWEDALVVWKEIQEDTRRLYPGLFDEASARLSNMAFYSWYQMVLFGFEDDEYEKDVLDTIRLNANALYNSNNIVQKVKRFVKLLVINTFVCKKLICLKGKLR